MDSKSLWETIAVPSRTCMLYVKEPGDYRCTYGEDFEVVFSSCVLIIHNHCLKRKQEVTASM